MPNCCFLPEVSLLTLKSIIIIIDVSLLTLKSIIIIIEVSLLTLKSLNRISIPPITNIIVTTYPFYLGGNTIGKLFHFF